jgi:ABC-type transport system involved in cytochrome bd biosynthesis fused ATPase/permease subunit
MNKVVKIILAISIAVLYPVVAFLLALTISPEYKATVSRPQYPAARECGTRTTNSLTYERCQDRQRQEYDKALDEYEDERKYIESQAAKVTANRIKVALVLVIIGFAIMMAAKSVSAVAAGMAGGSTILLAFAAGFAVSKPSHIDFVSELMFLTTFVFLVILMFLVDTVFKLNVLPPAAADDKKAIPEPETNKQKEK